MMHPRIYSIERSILTDDAKYYSRKELDILSNAYNRQTSWYLAKVHTKKELKKQKKKKKE